MKTHCARMGCLHGLVVVLTLLSTGISHAQTPAPAPVSAETTIAPALWKLDPLGQGMSLPTSCPGYQDRNGPLLMGDPLLDSGPGSPGWVAGVDLGVVVPHIKNGLFNNVTRAS